jgi:pimeloyl-ACP methyl ester carboxylesterase
MATDGFTEEFTVSSDGTRIGWLRIGRGPALVVSHGGARAARHYRALALALADRFSVALVDRRGRGLSGPIRPGHNLAQEIDDLAAVLRATGAERVFGHSGGGLYALEAAPSLPIRWLAVYEPPVALAQLISIDWMPEMIRSVEAHRPARAFALLSRGLQLAPRLPIWLMAAGGWLMMRGREGREIAALIETLPADFAVLEEIGSDIARYAGVRCPTLLIDGARSPAYLQRAVDLLAGVLPDQRRVRIPDASHNAPDMEAPRAVAEQLAAFFAAPAQALGAAAQPRAK